MLFTSSTLFIFQNTSTSHRLFQRNRFSHKRQTQSPLCAHHFTQLPALPQQVQSLRRVGSELSKEQTSPRLPRASGTGPSTLV